MEYDYMIIKQQHETMDDDRTYHYDYEYDPGNMKKRSICKSKRMRRIVEETFSDKKNGLAYATGMAEPQVQKKRLTRKKKNNAEEGYEAGTDDDGNSKMKMRSCAKKNRRK